MSSGKIIRQSGIRIGYVPQKLKLAVLVPKSYRKPYA
ncbi:zinc ABC transporter ATP-binding protein [Vibrio cholerae]|nr:zinc ABC transporter ATP-binding protein [Vibrio cholerae]